MLWYFQVFRSSLHISPKWGDYIYMVVRPILDFIYFYSLLELRRSLHWNQIYCKSVIYLGCLRASNNIDFYWYLHKFLRYACSQIYSHGKQTIRAYLHGIRIKCRHIHSIQGQSPLKHNIWIFMEIWVKRTYKTQITTYAHCTHQNEAALEHGQQHASLF